LALVGVDHQIMRLRSVALGHERPFHAGREAGAAAAAQTGFLHLVDDPVAAFFYDGLGAIPVAALARRVEPPILEAVEVGEDAILIGEHFPLLPAPRRGGRSARPAWAPRRASRHRGCAWRRPRRRPRNSRRRSTPPAHSRTHPGTRPRPT